MIHPSSELRFVSPEIGYGVVATEFIPKGTITWVLDRLDREFTPLEIDSFEEPYREILDKYCYRNSAGRYVLCWDTGRFVNHSFNSNCIATAYDFEIAVRDIQPGEELTDDYGYLNITEPFRALDEGRRRKQVYPDDLVRYHRTWDRQLAGAFKRVHEVPQPLRVLLSDATWRTCERIARGEEEMRSIINLYYDPNTSADAPAAGADRIRRALRSRDAS